MNVRPENSDFERVCKEKIGLINPPWHLASEPQGFGCQHPHPPLAFLYALSLMGDAESEPDARAFIIDAHLMGYSMEETSLRILEEQPDYIVMSTAPGYGDWKVAPIGLDIPRQTIEAIRRVLPTIPIILCGPHGSSNPDEVMKALPCDGVIRGEPEEVIAELGSGWASNPYIFTEGKHPWNVEKAVASLEHLPAIDYSSYPLHAARHMHRFLGPVESQSLACNAYPQTDEQTPDISVDIEWSRGCTYGCTFCNRSDFRAKYRERPIETVLTEMMALKKRGINFVNFVDDLFGLGRTPELLIEMRRRPIPAFGIQTRVDLWDEKGIDFLAAAGCSHVEFGMESPLPEVLQGLQRQDGYSLKRSEEVLLHAVSRIRSVQVSLMEPDGMSEDSKKKVRDWREKMLSKGCCVSEPVKIFPYPGTLYFKQRVAPMPLTASGVWDKANKFYNLELSRL